MNVMPVHQALCSSNEHEGLKGRKNPSFGLQLTDSAENTLKFIKIHLSKKTFLSETERRWASVVNVIDELKKRDFDQLRLDITRVADKTRKELMVVVERLKETFNGKPPRIARICNSTIAATIDTLAELFTDEKGAALHPLILCNNIFSNALSLCGKNPIIRTSTPYIHEVSGASAATAKQSA